MRFSPVSVAVITSSLLGIAGCAATAGSERVVVAVDSQAAHSSSEVVQVTEVVQPVPLTDSQAAPTRPRLAQTITLGQGTTEPVYSVPQQQQGSGPNGGNVVVNNNVTVVNGTPGYGGYGGYGYGGYGYGGTGAGRDVGRGANGTASTSRSAWAPSGWEGAGRTAAPGHTPGVGGNWAPATSHGPRTLK